MEVSTALSSWLPLNKNVGEKRDLLFCKLFLDEEERVGSTLQAQQKVSIGNPLNGSEASLEQFFAAHYLCPLLFNLPRDPGPG